MQLRTREDIVVACSEEAARIEELLGCKTIGKIASGSAVGTAVWIKYPSKS